MKEYLKSLGIAITTIYGTIILIMSTISFIEWDTEIFHKIGFMEIRVLFIVSIVASGMVMIQRENIKNK